MFICCAIGSPDSCPALLLLAGHSTCVLRWVGRGTRRSDRLPSLSLLLYFLVHHIAPSLVLFLLNPMWVFSSGQLTIWGVGWPLASPPAAKPSTLTKAKLPFLPDETLDFLNTSDARHLIFLFDALLVCTAYYAASKTGALLGSTEEGGLKMILNTWRLVLLWWNISQSPCHLQRSDAAPSSQMPGWSPHHRPPCFSHWPGSAQEVGLDCGPEVFLISLLQVWVQIFIQAAIPCSERWISAILRIFWWEIWICPRNMRAFPPQICLVFLSSWEMFVFQGMLSLLKKASELLQVLEVRREWFGVKKQQTLTGNRVTLTDILIVHFSNKHIRWEVDLTFKVTGRGRIGADGLAFWYTAAKVCLSLRLFFLFQWNNVS